MLNLLLTNCAGSISGMFPVASARAPSVPSVALYLNENGNLSIPENLVMTEGRTELRQYYLLLVYFVFGWRKPGQEISTKVKTEHAGSLKKAASPTPNPWGRGGERDV